MVDTDALLLSMLVPNDRFRVVKDEHKRAYELGSDGPHRIRKQKDSTWWDIEGAVATDQKFTPDTEVVRVDRNDNDDSTA